MKRIYTGLFCCCVFSIQSFSQTWNGSQSNDWNNALNWTPNNVPTTSGNVVINKGDTVYQPVLPGNVSIRSLNMTAGFLNLNGYTLTCSAQATFTGDSLRNGKVVSATFNDLANMHMGGKIILEKTGASNEFWQGKNKFYGDSLIIIWRTGGLSMENAALSPDSIFGNMKLVYSDNNETTYRISIGVNSPIYIQNDLILDNPDKGTFGLDYSNEKVIGGNIKAIDFSSAVPNFPLANVTVLGSNPNGPFYAHTGSIDNCRFNGNFSFIADSNVTINITDSYFAGADNLLQAGGLWTHDNRFGQTVANTTIIRAAYNGTDGSVRLRGGNNKFFGNAQWETYAAYPGGITIEHNYYGNDTTLGNLSFIMKGNASLVTNTNGYNYTGGNLTIDGKGARKWIQFTGGTGKAFNIGGSFTVKNFTLYTEAGIPPGTATNVQLRNITASGTDTAGTFYCYTGNITDCSFNGNFKLIADSSQPYYINNSSLSGADNLFRAGNLDIQNSRFGKTDLGTTILDVAPNVTAPVYVRDGGNKILGNLQLNATGYPGGSMLVQQTYYNTVDTVLGNFALNVSGYTSADLAFGAALYLGKGLSLQNNGTGTITQSNGVPGIRFIGADTANYSFSGTGSAPSFIMIEMNRRGGLRLLSPLTYRDYLVFTRGIILSSSSNPVIVPASAVVVGAWDSSYVNGPVRKVGNSSFTFPLGENNIYAPLSITAPANTTDAFTAQYFKRLAHADGYDSTQHDISLDHLSRKEYWMLGRTAGTSAVQVSLSWKTLRSGEINAMNDLRVAHWNGTTWKDEGNGGTTGTNAEGTIQSFNAINSFSPFTLASAGLTNPLPVRYISFEVQLNANRTVLLRWKTANEINNDHFEVERSGDGINWINLANVHLQSSHEYNYTDILPNEGFNYYRIKEVDIDGKYFYTQVKLVQLINQTELFIWPNPASDELHVQLSFTYGTIEIADIGGRIIWKNKLTTNNPVIRIRELKDGVYVIRIKHNDKTYVEKFIKE